MKTYSTILAAVIGLMISTGARAAGNPALMQPVKSVYEHYLVIQADLAKDSLQGVPAAAGYIAKLVEGDSMKMLPSKVALQAKTLAKARDLKAARAAFKPLSESLITYLKDHNARGAYVEIHCPMAKASWLQTDKDVKNPYLGTAMEKCGVIKE